MHTFLHYKYTTMRHGIIMRFCVPCMCVHFSQLNYKTTTSGLLITMNLQINTQTSGDSQLKRVRRGSQFD